MAEEAWPSIFSDFNVTDLIRSLQDAKKIAPFLAKKTVEIANVSHIEKDTSYSDALKQAKVKLQSEIPFNVEESYDCAYLHTLVLDKLRMAQSDGCTTIVLENRCCSNCEECPEIRLMQYIIDGLRSVK